jgi:hypothetical protein
LGGGGGGGLHGEPDLDGPLNLRDLHGEGWGGGVDTCGPWVHLGKLKGSCSGNLKKFGGN